MRVSFDRSVTTSTTTIHVSNFTFYRGEAAVSLEGGSTVEPVATGGGGSESESESSQRSSTGKDFEMVDQEDLDEEQS